MAHDHPFYDVYIHPDREQEYIQSLLKKYKKEPVDEALQKKIWEELNLAKQQGRIKIPFKVVIRRDDTHKFPDRVEVILDTKV